MRGSKAKKIRKEVYGDDCQKTRKYAIKRYEYANGVVTETRVNVGNRKVYQEVKKTCGNGVQV